MSWNRVADAPPETLTDLGTALARLEDYLSFALALKSERDLRLAVLAGRQECEAPLSQRTGLVRITEADFSITRQVIPDGAPASPTFVDLLDDPGVVRILTRLRAQDAIGGKARELVGALVEGDRTNFKKLLEWSAIIEGPAYGIATRITAALDELRPEVRAASAGHVDSGGRLVLAYYKLLETLERATLIATEPGSPWLIEMAASFTWEVWTPSFSLVRERTVWSMLIGARAASRFGSAMIDGYLEALLRAEHNIMRIDAIVGLTAIGIREPDQRNSIVERLTRTVETLRAPNACEIALLWAQAQRLLTGKQQMPSLSYGDRLRNALANDASGQMRVVKLLPAALDGPAWKFVPPASERRPASVSAAQTAFTRAHGTALDQFSGVIGHA